MDRGGDTSRFPNQIKLSGHKRLLFPASDKSKKGRIKSLSAVSSGSSRSYKEMVGGHVSCGTTQLKREEDEGEKKKKKKTKQLHPSGNGTTGKKRLKLPRKRLADDSPGAYCSSVPRKLRSAMRKRNGESISQAFLGSNKLNGVSGGLKLSERDGGKKSKLNVKQGNPDCIPIHCLHGPITKDEEEVAEALYALAGMFDQKDECKKRSQLNDTSLSPSAPPQQSEVPSQAFEVINEETRVCPASQPAQDVERSLEVITNYCSSKQALPNYVEREKLNRETENSFSQLTSDIRQSKLEEQKPFCSYSTRCTQQEPNKDLDANNVKQDSKLGIVLLNGKPDVAMGLSTRIAPQANFQDTASRTEKDAWWPGLDSITQGGAPSSWSFPAKLPPWLDAALCSKKLSSSQDCSIEKVPKVDHDQKSRKRCTTHLYISRLIQSMQSPKAKDSMPSNPDQPRPREVLNHGVLLSMNSINGIRGGFSGTRLNHDAVGANGKHTKETARCNPEQHKHFPEQLRGTVPLGTRSSEKQIFNFLSLSTDGGGGEADYSIKGVKNEVQTSKPLSVPPPNSSTKQSTAIPFSLSQSYPSPAYLHQPPTSSASWQAQLPPPAYVSHSFGESRANTSMLTKQHNEQRKHQEQQHQQWLWAAHMATQYRVNGASTSMNHYQCQNRGSQNGRPDFSMVMPCVKPGTGGPSPSSSFTIDALGSKPQISQHQQHAMTVSSSLPHSIIQKRDHLSSVFDDNGSGGFRAGTALRFQLLCNEHL